MRGHYSNLPFGRGGLLTALSLAVVLATLLTIGSTSPASAIPSFARQTGQPCGTCHTDAPALTPFGRRFMMLGFTPGGGPFRTTPFSSDSGRAARDEFNKLRGYAKALENAPTTGDDSKEWVPPISMAALVGFTHTQAPLPPPADPYQPNDNLVLSTVNLYWGGAITDNIGAFAQVTRSAPPPGGFPDAFGHSWSWDMTDVRYANSANIGGVSLIYGITVNNSPTSQDPWNTTPLRRFPYEAESNVAPDPGASTLIEGAFMANVVGAGAYALLNDMLYLEATAYTSIKPRAQNFLGVDPLMSPGMINGVAPYWRVALEPNWGRHSLMVGTFGMFAKVNPWAGGMGMGIDDPFATFQQTDNYTDIGVDTQYQYQGDKYWLTLRGSYISETQRLYASFSNGNAANPTNRLNSLQLLASVAYGNDNRVALTAQYFNVWGSSDPMLYAGLASGMSPNSDGWKAEIAYIPFSSKFAPGYPWGNVRVGLQYTWYNKFQGTTVGAHDNNTLFLYARFFM